MIKDICRLQATPARSYSRTKLAWYHLSLMGVCRDELIYHRLSAWCENNTSEHHITICTDGGFIIQFLSGKEVARRFKNTVDRNIWLNNMGLHETGFMVL